MKLINTIEQARKDGQTVSKQVNDLFAVIVLTENKYHQTSQYGVQYWTRKMIDDKFSRNTDHSISEFIEYL